MSSPSSPSYTIKRIYQLKWHFKLWDARGIRHPKYAATMYFQSKHASCAYFQMLDIGLLDDVEDRILKMKLKKMDAFVSEDGKTAYLQAGQPIHLMEDKEVREMMRKIE